MCRTMLIACLLAAFAPPPAANAAGSPVSPYYEAASREMQARIRARDALNRERGSVCDDVELVGKIQPERLLTRQQCVFNLRFGEKRKALPLEIVLLRTRSVDDACSCEFLPRYTNIHSEL